jgi:hypothetical protein
MSDQHAAMGGDAVKHASDPSLAPAASRAVPAELPRHSFDAPAEADWHRMISEAAYYRAKTRDFSPGEALDDWLKAEAEVKSMLVSS